MEATAANPSLILHLDCNKPFILEAASSNIQVLQHAPQEFRDGATFVTSCVQQNGLALQHAGESIRNNKDVVLAALSQSAASFAFCHEDLRTDVDVLNRCIQCASEDEKRFVATALQKRYLKTLSTEAPSDSSSSDSSESESKPAKARPRARQSQIEPETKPELEPAKCEEPAMVENDEESSESLEAAEPSKRGMATLLNWSCRRSYPAKLEARQRLKQLIPEDLTNAGFADAIRRALRTTQNLDKLQRMMISDEPHKRWKSLPQQTEPQPEHKEQPEPAPEQPEQLQQPEQAHPQLELKPDEQEQAQAAEQTLLPVQEQPKQPQQREQAQPQQEEQPSTRQALRKRERHKHAAMKMSCTFAHKRITDALAEEGITAYFSFFLSGYHAYCSYLLSPSGKKLASDIDANPYIWPKQTVESLKQETTEALKKIQGKTKIKRFAAEHQDEKPAKERKKFTFSEFCDTVAENNLVTVRACWELANSRKAERGDGTLLNYLDSVNPRSQLRKARQAIDPSLIDPGSLNEKAQFALDTFDWETLPGLKAWLEGGCKTKALILSGKPGLAKTELGCALLHHICGRFHFVSQMDEMKDVEPDRDVGILVDEVCLSHLNVNEAKKWMMIDKRRKVHCRNEDGAIAAGTPLIMSTNMRKKPGRNSFWPDLKYDEDQEWALDRRTVWIDVQRSVIKNAAPQPIISSPIKKRIAENKRLTLEKKAARQAEAAAAEAAAAAAPEEDDVFGFGGGLDNDDDTWMEIVRNEPAAAHKATRSPRSRVDRARFKF